MFQPKGCKVKLPCMHQTAPPNSSWVQTKCNARAYQQCVWQRRVIPWYPYVLVTYYVYNCTWTPLCIDAWNWFVSCLACNRPPRQTAVESNKMQCKSLPTMCLTKKCHTMISLCTCYVLCQQLHLNTTMYWCVQLICQLSQRFSLTDAFQKRSTTLCLLKPNVLRFRKHNVKWNCKQKSALHQKPLCAKNELSKFHHVIPTRVTMMRSVTRNKCLHHNSLLCFALRPHGIRHSSLHCLRIQ